MQFTIFVTSLIKNNNSRVVATASNGGASDKPTPEVRWELPSGEITTCRIGTRYSVKIQQELD